jgi:hypothetical protein
MLAPGPLNWGQFELSEHEVNTNVRMTRAIPEIEVLFINRFIVISFGFHMSMKQIYN